MGTVTQMPRQAARARGFTATKVIIDRKTWVVLTHDEFGEEPVTISLQDAKALAGVLAKVTG